MFEYYSLLRSRYELPIFPIVVYLRRLRSEGGLENDWAGFIDRLSFPLRATSRPDAVGWRPGWVPSFDEGDVRFCRHLD